MDEETALSVVCVLKSGGDFDVEYVERLYEGVAANLQCEFYFCCFTDLVDDLRPLQLKYENVVAIPLMHDLPGWWSKMELFVMTGPCLYFDLDTVINGRLDEIANLDEPFVMLRDVGRYDRPASGMMMWQGDHRYLLQIFLGNRERIMAQYMDKDVGSRGGPWGDGGFIGVEAGRERGIKFFQDLVTPGTIVSYKWQTKAEREAASVICYHGPPRPKQTGWEV